jgi:hypothetical protein
LTHFLAHANIQTTIRSNKPEVIPFEVFVALNLNFSHLTSRLDKMVSSNTKQWLGPGGENGD